MSIAMVLPPDGRVVACDVSQEYADVGKPLWKEVGMTSKIHIQTIWLIKQVQFD